MYRDRFLFRFIYQYKCVSGHADALFKILFDNQDLARRQNTFLDEEVILKNIKHYCSYVLLDVDCYHLNFIRQLS